MFKKHKKYNRPKQKFDIVRINAENDVKKAFGLKNKKEIWKADAEIGRIRRRAKTLITENKEEQDKFINKLKKQGFSVENIADILALKEEDLLRRRLQSIVSKKKKVTMKTARQLITHKHVSIDGKRIDVPSYIVPIDKENKIEIILKQKTKDKEKIIEPEKAEEKPQEQKEKPGEKVEDKQGETKNG